MKVKNLFIDADLARFHNRSVPMAYPNPSWPVPPSKRGSSGNDRTREGGLSLAPLAVMASAAIHGGAILIAATLPPGTSAPSEAGIAFDVVEWTPAMPVEQELAEAPAPVPEVHHRARSAPEERPETRVRSTDVQAEAADVAVSPDVATEPPPEEPSAA
ncbi:MAG: hypothetical protein KC416_14425, partial [Myxococcales bacterium]|nr:hypothetical protein [Myxococcales bacterium]